MPQDRQVEIHQSRANNFGLFEREFLEGRQVKSRQPLISDSGVVEAEMLESGQVKEIYEPASVIPVLLRTRRWRTGKLQSPANS